MNMQIFERAISHVRIPTSDPEALGGWNPSREISRALNLHIHELISTAILYGEDGLSFLGERWSYHLGKHTTRGLRTSTS